MGKEKDERRSTVSSRRTNMKEVRVEVLSGGKPIKHFIVEAQGRPSINANGSSIVSLGEFPPLPRITIKISPERGNRIQFNEQVQNYLVKPRANTVTFHVHSRVVRTPRRSQANTAAADAWQAEIMAHHATVVGARSSNTARVQSCMAYYIQ